MTNYITSSVFAKHKALKKKKKRQMKALTIYVRTESDAQALVNVYYTLNPLKKQCVRVESSVLSPGETDFWSNALTQALNNCGCEIAAAFLLAVLVIWVLVVISLPQTRSTLLLEFCKLALWMLFGLFVGKGIGVAWAKLKLRTRVHELSGNHCRKRKS